MLDDMSTHRPPSKLSKIELLFLVLGRGHSAEPALIGSWRNLEMRSVSRPVRTDLGLPKILNMGDSMVRVKYSPRRLGKRWMLIS